MSGSATSDPVARNSGTHVLIVVTHPDSSSATHAIATTLARTLEAHGHTTEVADLVAEGFDPVFGPADQAAFASGGALPAKVRAEQQRIDHADHLVLVYPVYWWAMPAMLKGWIDRVFVAGWAFGEDDDGNISKRLGRLKVSLVAVAGASRATYDKRGYRHAMAVQIETGIVDFCGAPIIVSELVTPDRIAEPAALQDIAKATAAQIVAR